MASTEEAVKNDNSTAQSNNSSESSKSSQPTANPGNHSASAKVSMLMIFIVDCRIKFPDLQDMYFYCRLKENSCVTQFE